MHNKRVLGKGLSALIGDDITETSDQNRQELSINQLMASSIQPRKEFVQESLEELATSIKRNGILQPILVRGVGDGKFEIIAGERRWRAASMAGLDAVPVIVLKIDTDDKALEIALIENLQRSDLSILEEAMGYSDLSKRYGYSQEKLASTLGKSRSHITNILRLLNLPNDIKDLLNAGSISAGHARALLNAENASQIAENVVSKGLSVRALENLIKRQKHSGPTNTRKKASKQSTNTDILVIERSLSEHLKTNVKIEDHNGSGKIIISFNNLEELDRVLQSFDINQKKEDGPRIRQL